MKYSFLIDKSIREHIRKHNDGSISTFIYYALNDYLSYLQQANVQTLLEEIIKANKISLRKGGSITMKCRITKEQFKHLTTWGRYAKPSKIMNRALQYYIEKVHGTRIDLKAVEYKNAKSLTMELQEENLEKIEKLKYSGEIEKAIKSYVEHFENLDVIGKLCEIAKINSTPSSGKKRKIEIYNVDTSHLKRLCEKYGLKIKYTLVRAVKWYMESCYE